MRNMLAFLAAATLTVAGVGWYLDWFKLHSVPAESGHRQLSIDFDTSKIKHDVHQAEKKIETKLADKNQSTADTNVNPLAKAHPHAPTDPQAPGVEDILPKLNITIEK
jgi:hypothetical protein